MKLIGHHYTDLQRLWTASGETLIMKGTKMKTIKDAFCQGALHYSRDQKPIPKNTVVEVEYTWCNFYGSYCTVNYKGDKYDLKPSDLKINKP